MAAITLANKRFTLEEYIAFEEASEIRHWLNGCMIATLRNHTAI
jgi:hypothetical protein